MLCQVLTSVLLEILILAFLAKKEKRKKKKNAQGGKGQKRLSGDLTWDTFGKDVCEWTLTMRLSLVVIHQPYPLLGQYVIYKMR